MGDDYKAHFARRKRWTEMEKRTLLRALKKYGSENIKEIKEFLPNKTFSSIEQMIRKYRTIAELGKKNINSPLDVWIKSGIFSNDTMLVPEALLFIQLFENHPLPEETAGFNLKEVYQFLYEATKGQIMTNLSRKTAEMFKQLIFSVDKEIWPANEYSTTEYLINKLSKLDSDKCYENRKKIN